MRLAARIAITALIILALPAQTDAQKASYTSNGGLTLGFGLGASYQSSDIFNSKGMGFDASLGSHLWKREGSLLSADWKFRFVAGENWAYDHRERTDGTFNNVLLGYFNYDLEIGLTLNRLKERTRIIVTGFAGVGMTHGLTFADLLDEDGLPYNYSSINTSQSRDAIYADLLALSDRGYETKLGSKGAIMPTAGIYLGYQFTKSFSLGIEHKMNFSLSEKNGAFGINIDNNIVEGSGIDINHYTSLGFKWSLGRSAPRTPTHYTYSPVNSVTPQAPPDYPVLPATDPTPVKPATRPVTTRTNPPTTRPTNPPVISRPATQVPVRTNPPATTRTNPPTTTTTYPPVTTTTFPPATTTTNPQVTTTTNPPVATTTNPAQQRMPEIRFVNPSAPLTVENGVFPLRVQTTHLRKWEDVTITVNSSGTSNFSYSPEGLVTTNIGLTEGANIVEVTGRNDAGSRSEKTTITYTKPVKVAPPVITIQQPSVSPFKTYEVSQDIVALVSGVQSRESISVKINGANINSFSFDSKTQTLNLKTGLKEGANNVIISAQNESGSDSESLVIVKETRPCPAPVIVLIAPARNPANSDKQTIEYKAEIRNISNTSQLRLSVNGSSVTNFNFTGGILNYSATLRSGANSITLEAINDCEKAMSNLTINYTPEVVVPCTPPQLTMGVNQINQTDATHELKGTATNVKNKSDITLTINGKAEEGFQFVPSTGDISSKFRFTTGTWTVVMSVRNECGNDSKTTTVTVAEPCIPPTIRLTVGAVNRTDASHEVKGISTNIKSKGEITLSVNGSPFAGFSFMPTTGEITAKLNLTPGTHNISLGAKNSCGEDLNTVTVIVKEEITCGPRINPGNSSWQFCLITPRGTYTRDNLTNTGFSYTGPASSLYILPIAGGGDAIVNGKPYTLKSGQYYLFTGNLTVTVSTKNPGSMGHWSVCIVADKEPISGNGNNRPKSPCEENDN